ncbi:NAD(P)H-hydrate dehydratase [Bacillus piscicola]|uniref:NAD(P)H-hydrate dehydratase n=1 Tax=Bacillus piscicola TaxID=1632684 RepID=UPI001F09E55E|nr:NAD(P)H-hydrate dehydratase [Bacillus piscicola]
MQVVTGEEMREMDRYTMDVLGMNEEVLMENAGRAAAHELEKLYPALSERKIAVLAGKGSNGGDGFVIARTLLEKGMDVHVWLLEEEEKVQGAARYHFHLYEACGYEWNCFSDGELFQNGAYDLFIDAMLGTGITGELRPPYRKAAEVVNSSAGDVVAIDIPSGVPAGEEEVPSVTVNADVTIAIQSPKCSAYLYPAKEHYGRLTVVDIGLPQKARQHVPVKRRLWTDVEARSTLPKRAAASHKGDHGKGLLIGGSSTMPGAVSLSASACLYSGCGLLTTAAPDSVVPMIAARVPETMFLPLPDQEGILGHEISRTDFQLEAFDGVAAGPGLGRTEEVKTLIRRLLKEVQVPLLLDADALYYLPELESEMKERHAPLLLTPHPGEMARLAGLSVQKVNQNRFSLSRQFAEEYGCYLVLKGPNTIVTTPEGMQFINTTGNEALARGGTGDVLTGIALGIFLQGEDIAASLSNAVYLHGLTAEIAVERTAASHPLAASDFIHLLPLAFRSIILSD